MGMAASVGPGAHRLSFVGRANTTQDHQRRRSSVFFLFRGSMIPALQSSDDPLNGMYTTTVGMVEATSPLASLLFFVRREP